MSEPITWTNGRLRIGDLEPREDNPRQSTKKQVARIKQSVNDFGQVDILAVGPQNDKGKYPLYNGHQRYYAWLDEFGPDYMVDVRISNRPLETEEWQALTITLHAGATGGWDWDKLPSIDTDILEGFGLLDADLLKGWQQDYFALGEMLAANETENKGKDTEPQVTEVEAERLAKLYGVKFGQVWQLGKHKIACLDSTDEITIDNFVGSFRFNAMITDPPYGVNYEGGRNPISNIPREKLNGDDSGKLYSEFLSIWKKYRQEKGVLYLWFASSVGKPVFDAVYENGFTIRSLLIWNKIDPHYGNFMAQYMQKHEPCLYCVCKDGTNWYGPTNEVTVWDIKQPNINEYHPTQKPLECMSRPIKNSTKVDDVVFDPFIGSGTTLAACEELNRICLGVDISPNFIGVTIHRWVNATGLEPVCVYSCQ